MNKKTKSVLVWTTTGVVLAGITVGITVPLVLASQKETDLNIFTGLNDPFAGGHTGNDLLKMVNNEHIADQSLLNDLSYQAAFYLYEKEQKGSLNYQMMTFKWDMYSMAKDTGAYFDASETMMNDAALDAESNLDNLSEINKIRKQLVTLGQEINISEGRAKETDFYSNLSKYVDSNHKFIINKDLKEGIAPTKPNNYNDLKSDDPIKTTYDAQLSKYNDLNAQLKTKKELVNKTIDRMIKLDRTINDAAGDKIDYEHKDFSSDFPQVLLPKDLIERKQGEIYDEAKKAVVGSYKTAEEGELEWAKQIPTKYNGAKNRDEAIDYLVNTQVTTFAFTRFEFAINSDYSVKQYKSGIYSDILGAYPGDINGKPTAADVTAAGNKGIGLKLDAKDSDKVYFFGTKSKDVDMINALGQNEINEYIKDIEADMDLISIKNAIFPVKQGTTFDAPWTITKDDLIKLFQTMGTNNALPIQQWGEVFLTNGDDTSTDNTPTGTKTISDKDLIGRASATTDSTQWNEGDLGLKTELNYIKGMTSGWAAGVISILTDINSETDSSTGIRTPGDVTDDFIYTPANNANALEGLANTIIISFFNLAADKSWLGQNPNDKVAQGNDDPSGGDTDSIFEDVERNANAALTKLAPEIAKSTWNTNVRNFINSLTDEEITRSFGADIRNYFANLPVEVGTGTLSGIPVAIQITSDVYMTFTEEFGIHVMKFDTSATSATNPITSRLVKDLQTAAKEQSTSKVITDYAGLLTERLSLERKLQLIMTNDPSNASATINKEFKDYIAGEIEYDVNGDGEINDTDKNDPNRDQVIWDDAAKLINNRIEAEHITLINGVDASALNTWLTTRIDNRLAVNPSTNTGTSLAPEDIYNLLVEIGGN